MIRSCTDDDIPAIDAIINEAASVYRGVIPADCWHEPYMKRSELVDEIAKGVRFSGWDEAGVLVGVMGLQTVRDVTLIRHAYVRPSHQSRGVGGALLTRLEVQTAGPLLVGTWASTRYLLEHFLASAANVGRPDAFSLKGPLTSSQVPGHRMLSLCGEVAERLKAAVC